MKYSQEVERMCPVTKGPCHGPAPIPEEGKWVKSYEVKDISGLSHGVGWCAPQQGACKLTLNVKDGIVEEALVETVGCSGMTHSAAMAAEILPGKTLLECLNTDLVCDAINVAMRKSSSNLHTEDLKPRSLKEDFLSVLLLKILARAYALKLVPCSALRQKVFVTWKWQKVTLHRLHLTKTTKLLDINSLESEKCSKTYATE